jgi:hypothetical protein
MPAQVADVRFGPNFGSGGAGQDGHSGSAIWRRTSTLQWSPLRGDFRNAPGYLPPCGAAGLLGGERLAC